MANLLLNERPLVVLPRLAEALGSVDKAIILQQLNYWVKKSKNYHDGRPWVYNSMDSWAKQFPWIKSKTTIKKHFKDLKKLGLVLTGNFNQYSFDRTTWYTIDYEAFEKFSDDFFAKKDAEKQEDSVRSIDQELAEEGPKNGLHKGQKMTNDNGQKLSQQYHRLPEITTETTTEKNMSGKSDEIPFKKIISYLNEKTDNSYKPSAEGHKKFIRARWHEGNSLDDFKMVIDYKANEWMGTKWEIYLRPKTLFATGNFDNYLAAAKKELNGQESSLFANQWQPQGDDDLPF